VAHANIKKHDDYSKKESGVKLTVKEKVTQAKQSTRQSRRKTYDLHTTVP